MQQAKMRLSMTAGFGWDPGEFHLENHVEGHKSGLIIKYLLKSI